MQYYSTVADHYMYLPMFGVGVGVAFAAALFPTRTTAWACGVVIGVLAVRSFLQAAYWDNSFDLYHHILSVNDRSYMAHTNLASYYASVGQNDKAEAMLRRATAANPDYWSAWEQLSYLLIQLGRVDAAIDAEKEAMRVREFLPSHGGDNYAETMDVFGQLLLKRNRYAEAVEQFEHALRVKPSYAPAREHLDEARRAWHESATRPASVPSAP
jgi:tetratricopeptide (TPR) repeat protein